MVLDCACATMNLHLIHKCWIAFAFVSRSDKCEHGTFHAQANHLIWRMTDTSLGTVKKTHDWQLPLQLKQVSHSALQKISRLLKYTEVCYEAASRGEWDWLVFVRLYYLRCLKWLGLAIGAYLLGRTISMLMKFYDSHSFTEAEDRRMMYNLICPNTFEMDERKCLSNDVAYHASEKHDPSHWPNKLRRM